VRYLHQSNRGLPGARNRGLAETRSEFVVFLDADDRLLPGAISAGLARLVDKPEAAFTSGDHRYIDIDGRVVQEWSRPFPSADHYQALLRGNYIGMGATVMFRRAVVEQVGGFDPSLAACEDYDLYLRISRSHPVDTHQALVAEYRRHSNNMSADPGLMLRLTLTVLKRQEPFANAPEQRAALEAGIRYWEDFYGR